MEMEMAEPPHPPLSRSKSKSKSTSTSTSTSKQHGGGGLLSRFLRAIFPGHDDLETRLHILSREEASLRARIKKRARSSRRLARNVIAVSMSLEVLVLLVAVLVGTPPQLSWQLRSLRFLSLVLLPVCAALAYYIITRLIHIFNQRDRNALERLREQRQAKIDELKERTNYYATQQLIQRYDLDPAEKAAAAAVLASKLGTDSGLKLSIEDEPSSLSSPNLIRRRSVGPILDSIEESSNELSESEDVEETNQKVLEKYKIPGVNNEGWLAQIAALLVGEHPSQCYALICCQCHMHNGLARKEDIPFITYYCPHCRALNGARQNEEQEASPVAERETPAAPSAEKAATGSSPVEEIHENGVQEEQARDD